MAARSDMVRRLAGLLAVFALVFGAALHGWALPGSPPDGATGMAMAMADGQCADGDHDGTQRTICDLLCASAAAILPPLAPAISRAHAASVLLPLPARLEHRLAPDPFPPRSSVRA